MALLSIVGLGKIGSCLMAVMATKHEVVGVDNNEQTVKLINDGTPPVVEPGLKELLFDNRQRWHATSDFAEIVDTDVTFVIVPTPSDGEGRFKNDYVIEACTAIGKALRHKKDPHTVVITSTVMPSSTLGPIQQALRSNMGTAGPSCRLTYAPCFIALGSVISDMLAPDFILVGAEDPIAADTVEDLWQSVQTKDVPIARLTVPEAELCKLFVNSAVTMKVSFANTIAEICEGMPNVDAQHVAAAVGLDSRIGGKYLQPATKFAGECFPRDQQALLAHARGLATIAPLADATIAINDRQVDRLANLVESVAEPGATIGILGMAYKPGTPICTESIGVALAEELSRRDFNVVTHDPLATSAVTERFAKDKAVNACWTVAEVIAAASVVVVAQPCAEFCRYEDALLVRTTVDVWNMFGNPTFLRPGIYKWGIK